MSFWEEARAAMSKHSDVHATNDLEAVHSPRSSSWPRYSEH
jgi:hypothetical protein